MLAGTRPLSAMASQAAFRVLLDTLAHPGRPARLDVPEEVPAPLVVAMALADPTQQVAVVGPGARRWELALAETTGCRTAAPSAADLVIALDGGASADLVAGLRRGTSSAPEHAARLAVACAALDVDEVRLDASGGPFLDVVVSGPGVDGRRRFRVGGCTADVLRSIAVASSRFPTGVDVWLVADGGLVVGLPRSVTIDVIEVASWAT